MSNENTSNNTESTVILETPDTSISTEQLSPQSTLVNDGVILCGSASEVPEPVIIQSSPVVDRMDVAQITVPADAHQNLPHGQTIETTLVAALKESRIRKVKNIPTKSTKGVAKRPHKQ